MAEPAFQLCVEFVPVRKAKRKEISVMARRRPKGWLALGWTCIECAVTGRTEHVPTLEEFPDGVVKRITFQAGGGLGWKISALTTNRSTPAAWKIVVVTGAPSWAEYWAPALAALPPDREMIVVDRPGFAGSEPIEYIGDIRLQARALAPLLQTAPGQKLLLVGQSYGAAIATLMAAEAIKKPAGLVLLSALFGELGPTSRLLVRLGRQVARLIPRDLRNAVLEVSEQGAQLGVVREALSRLRVPVHVIHGDKDDFAPLEAAERWVAQARRRLSTRFHSVEGVDHFINDAPPAVVLECLEACIPRSSPFWRPRLPKINWTSTLRPAPAPLRA
jgi:pimeloyl-ACP methyl ester carboxylesterase